MLNVVTQNIKNVFSNLVLELQPESNFRRQFFRFYNHSTLSVHLYLLYTILYNVHTYLLYSILYSCIYFTALYCITHLLFNKLYSLIYCTPYCILVSTVLYDVDQILVFIVLQTVYPYLLYCHFYCTLYCILISTVLYTIYSYLPYIYNTVY